MPPIFKLMAFCNSDTFLPFSVTPLGTAPWQSTQLLAYSALPLMAEPTTAEGVARFTVNVRVKVAAAAVLALPA